MPTHALSTAHAAVPHAATSHARASQAAKVRVVVTDAVGLQRVLTMLAGRQHPFTRLEAEEAGGGRWTVHLDLIATPSQLELVTVRLHRLPSVLTVDVASTERLASTA